ncbi:uncharacterized protein MELLADRAFT_69192 [Melampsora larici-populina 98AG31]|uniref:Uncharacterized protein n=1 Tax=Melampsora larici-populina (strain 98AG31 / pathotype 3-4-7) TaxID=747676 RepID=F4S9R1_MELLP|nr:uncharacterized protein MELLADRAFT_69192 [Melampsora larici-populina 98AG31]EGF98623.1 hypothetical protein MELLADRAFT_69192 [Melampsora larici-populina 98AG31]
MAEANLARVTRAMSAANTSTSVPEGGPSQTDMAQTEGQEGTTGGGLAEQMDANHQIGPTANQLNTVVEEVKEDLDGVAILEMDPRSETEDDTWQPHEHAGKEKGAREDTPTDEEESLAEEDMDLSNHSNFVVLLPFYIGHTASLPPIMHLCRVLRSQMNLNINNTAKKTYKKVLRSQTNLNINNTAKKTYKSNSMRRYQDDMSGSILSPRKTLSNDSGQAIPAANRCCYEAGVAESVAKKPHGDRILMLQARIDDAYMRRDYALGADLLAKLTEMITKETARHYAPAPRNDAQTPVLALVPNHSHKRRTTPHRLIQENLSDFSTSSHDRNRL